MQESIDSVKNNMEKQQKFIENEFSKIISILGKTNINNQATTTESSNSSQNDNWEFPNNDFLENLNNDAYWNLLFKFSKIKVINL